jgi:hypothetical protein
MGIKRIAIILTALIIAGFGVYHFTAYSEKLTPSTDLSGETIGGVNLHDNINDSHLLMQYGSKYYRSNEQTADIIGYIDHKQGITLEFWCSPDAAVAEIRLDDADMR